MQANKVSARCYNRAVCNPSATCKRGVPSIASVTWATIGTSGLFGEKARNSVRGDGVAARKPWSYAVAFRQAIRHLGWLNGSLYAFVQIVTRVTGDRVRLHKYYLVAQPVPEKCWLPPHRGQAFEIRQVTELDPVIRQFPRPE